LSLISKKDEDSLYFFAGIDHARFKKPVIPGDQLILNAEVDRYKSGIWKFKAHACVGDDIVCQAELLCALRKRED
jgi:3-hydroxyacyl-[acyl-carrier-protein] dehydratase